MEEIVVFSTNLEPSELVDEAFLRRIRYKVRIGDPDEAAFREIFRRLCKTQGILYRDASVDWLIQTQYRAIGQPLRASHPRDLFQLVCDIAAFRGEVANLTPALLDQACRLYFAARAGKSIPVSQPPSLPGSRGGHDTLVPGETEVTIAMLRAPRGTDDR